MHTLLPDGWIRIEEESRYKKHKYLPNYDIVVSLYNVTWKYLIDEFRARMLFMQIMHNPPPPPPPRPRMEARANHVNLEAAGLCVCVCVFACVCVCLSLSLFTTVCMYERENGQT
jgi:hypothetical protein